MSIIGLRHLIARRGGQAAAAALVVLSVLVAAHHTAAPDAHAGHATPQFAAHGAMDGHAPAVPAPDGAAEADICLAVLPLLLLLTAVIAAMSAGRVWMRVPLQGFAAATVASVVTPRARAGPTVLCVMRR